MKIFSTHTFRPFSVRPTMVLITIFLLQCTSAKKTTSPPEDPNPRPSWVRQKPSEPDFFHGIGFAYKVPGRDDHHQIARNNALNNLSGEISINISNQSLLHQVESDMKVRETFQSVIRSTNTAKLEGYELVSVWENEREIWNYYRLSKAEHQRIQREKRTKATQMSLDQLRRAETESDPYRKFIGYINALEAVKEYLGEPLTTDYNGENIFLANHLMNKIRNQVDEWNLTGNKHLISIKRGQAVRVPSNFWTGSSIYFTALSGRDPLVNFPVVLSYSGQRNHRQNVLTDRNGHAYFVWERINSMRAQEQLHARIDLQTMVQEATKDPLILALVNQLREPAASLTIEVLPPKIFIRSEELLMGKPSDSQVLENVFTNEFRKDGFEIVRNPREADYILDINARTRGGNGRGETTQFVTAYLDATIQLFSNPDQNVIYSHQLNNVRGVQLDEERAARETYVRATRDIEREVYPDLRRKVFQ
ncbi:MAG: LPP20 family lipoprotein [Cryomorphaceae bacterium]|nr:LPP20 family lipoprotein [Cryomorphaceae bacterium]